jgi:LysR family glycine cleavage system transcriptional activator
MKVSHLNALRALEATLRKGSFKVAADELGVTTAAIGQQIRTLEAFLDRKLFLRTNTGVQPTDSALSIQQKLTTSFLTIEDIIGQLKTQRSKNRLAITLPSSFAEYWFTGRLPEFHKTNSEIDLRLDASNRMVDLLTEDFDFAIRYSPPQSETYQESILFGDYVLPICTPDFARQHQLSTDLRSLAGVPLIHLGKRTPDPEWVDWMKWGETFGFDPDSLRDGIHLTEFNSGIQTAIRGQGLVMCGLVEAYNSIKQGLLVNPFGPDLCCKTSYQYRLVSVHARALSNLQTQFQEWVVDTAGEFQTELTDFFLLQGK